LCVDEILQKLWTFRITLKGRSVRCKTQSKAVWQVNDIRWVRTSNNWSTTRWHLQARILRCSLSVSMRQCPSSSLINFWSRSLRILSIARNAVHHTDKRGMQKRISCRSLLPIMNIHDFQALECLGTFPGAGMDWDGEGKPQGSSLSIAGTDVSESVE